MNNIFLVFCIYFASTVNAYAYLDPGTGSIIISAIIAGIVTIKTYWNNLIQKLKKMFSKKKINKDN